MNVPVNPQPQVLSTGSIVLITILITLLILLIVAFIYRDRITDYLKGEPITPNQQTSIPEQSESHQLQERKNNVIKLLPKALQEEHKTYGKCNIPNLEGETEVERDIISVKRGEKANRIIHVFSKDSPIGPLLLKEPAWTISMWVNFDFQFYENLIMDNYKAKYFFKMYPNKINPNLESIRLEDDEKQLRQNKFQLEFYKLPDPFNNIMVKFGSDSKQLPKIQDSKWFHLVIVKPHSNNNTTLNVYLNGELTVLNSNRDITNELTPVVFDTLHGAVQFRKINICTKEVGKNEITLVYEQESKIFTE